MSKMDPERRKELRETFAHFDRDGSGYIDRRELKALVEMLGDRVSDEELDIGFDLVDANHDHRIAFNEFARWWEGR